MAMNNVIEAGALFLPENSVSKENTVSFGNGGGGSAVDSETKNYVDAKTRAVEAENSASFAGLDSRVDVLRADFNSKIDVLKSAIESKPNPPSILQILGGFVAVFSLAIAVAAFATNRFDAGMSSSRLVDDAVSRIEESQAKRDAEQDARLGLILKTLERQIETMQQNPPTERR